MNLKPIAFLLLQMLITNPDKVTGQFDPGKHNTTPITGCMGYNPAPLIFTTAPSGGQPPYAYQWQLNDVAISGESGSTYDPAQLTVSGIYRYNCAISDSSGAVVYTAPKVITIVPDPRVTVSGGRIVCQYESVTLTSEISDGTGVISYQWLISFDNVLYTSIPGANEPVYSPVTTNAGIQYYRVTASSSVGSCNNAVSSIVAVIINSFPITSAIYHY